MTDETQQAQNGASQNPDLSNLAANLAKGKPNLFSDLTGLQKSNRSAWTQNARCPSHSENSDSSPEAADPNPAPAQHCHNHNQDLHQG